ncbi:MAG: hypothetical protein H6828_12470 [Planctomycetes bacterium]|nr:hypothetical protein [Planctomycetota bacterium]
MRAPTGAGKTTRVPAALLDSAPDGQVWLLEPCRVAARRPRGASPASGAALGGEVGYRVRFDDRTSRATRLIAMTEGVFLRRVQQDPFLEGVRAVVFDEFHERGLDADLALALARRVQREARDDLRLVVMSATLDPAPLARFLDAPLVESAGRLHPVEVRWLEPHERPSAARGWKSWCAAGCCARCASRRATCSPSCPVSARSGARATCWPARAR